MLTVILYLYIVASLVFGFFAAQDTFTGKHDDRPRTPSQIQTGRPLWALLVWFNVALAWPLFLAAYLIGELIEHYPGSGRRLAERIFGEVQR